MRANRRAWSIVFWTAFILATYAFLAPGDSLPPTGEASVPHVDKAEHAVAFLVLALLARRAFAGPAWVVFVGLALYGAATELAQTRIPHRSADAWDWVADATGALAAFARRRYAE